jgi:hypothetical protein
MSITSSRRRNVATVDAANPRLRENAILVHLSISQWSARKFDKVVTQHVTKEYNAASNAGRWNKALFIDGKNTYTALVSYLASLRTEHYKLTLPYNDSGQRLLPTANETAYRQLVSDGITKVNDELLPAFIEDYPELKATAERNSLGETFRESDYPSADVVSGKFSISVEYDRLPNTSFADLGLSSEAQAQMERDAQQRAAQRIEAGMDDAWQRLHGVVERLQETLATPGAIFRNSLIGNVEEVVDMLATLNVTGDPRLEELRVAAKTKLLQYDADTLRNPRRASTRKQVAGHAAEILEALRGSRTIFQKPTARATGADAIAAA